MARQQFKHYDEWVKRIEEVDMQGRFTHVEVIDPKEMAILNKKRQEF